MRTRTLLLLAIGCGLAILLAGLFLLLRIDRADTPATRLAIGDTTQAGDLRVTVVAADEADDLMRVTVRIGGVDDAEAVDDFRLVVSGALIEPLPAVQAGAAACRAVTVEEQTCELVFGTAAVQGTARGLVLRRGEDQRRWDLAGG
jgi:hypothetical protein